MSAWGVSFGASGAVAGDPLTYAQTVAAVRAAIQAEHVSTDVDLEIINEGVKKASLLVPHTEDLP